MLDDDSGGGFTIASQTVVEVVLDGQSHWVESREEAIGLIADHYAGQQYHPALEVS